MTKRKSRKSHNQRNVSRRRPPRSRKRGMGGKLLRYRGEGENTLDTLLESISEHVNNAHRAEATLPGLRESFRQLLRQYLATLPRMQLDWFRDEKNKEIDQVSNYINEMLKTTLGVRNATPPRDPVTTQIIIDSLCERSVPFTLRFLCYKVDSANIPIEFLPKPSQKLVPAFREFWEDVGVQPAKWHFDLISGEYIHLLAHLNMEKVWTEKFSKAWRNFIRNTLPEDKKIFLFLDGEPMDVTFSWTKIFDKYSNKNKTNVEKYEKRIDISNDRIRALAQKVSGERVV